MNKCINFIFIYNILIDFFDSYIIILILSFINNSKCPFEFFSYEMLKIFWCSYPFPKIKFDSGRWISSYLISFSIVLFNIKSIWKCSYKFKKSQKIKNYNVENSQKCNLFENLIVFLISLIQQFSFLIQQLSFLNSSNIPLQ